MNNIKRIDLQRLDENMRLTDRVNLIYEVLREVIRASDSDLSELERRISELEG